MTRFPYKVSMLTTKSALSKVCDTKTESEQAESKSELEPKTTSKY